jgi:hypothetical protein
MAVTHNMAWRRLAGEGSVNHDRILQFHGKHAGERCFILGNGPSLAKMDLTLLQSEVTFGLNRIYLLARTMPLHLTYYVCMNELVLRQSASEIMSLDMTRFLNWKSRTLFRADFDTIFVHESFRPRFETDLTRPVWGGATVAFVALQIAFYMGFSQVVLIGVDHRYVTQGIPHKVVVSDGQEENHFDIDYFPKGFRWQLPDLATSEFAYRLVREAFEADGRQVLDATVNGRLAVFPKRRFETVLGV